MHAKRRTWPYVAAGVIAAAIPLSALFLEPTGKTEASSSAEQQEPGVLQQTDNLGYVWILQQAGGPSCLSFHKPGSPVTVKTDVRNTGSGVVLIGLVLEGRAGETYRPVVTKNRVPQDAPRLQIVDKQGNVLDNARFEYG
jgi:hypothetical protein